MFKANVDDGEDGEADLDDSDESFDDGEEDV